MPVVAGDTAEVCQLQDLPAPEILMCMWIFSPLLECAWIAVPKKWICYYSATYPVIHDMYYKLWNSNKLKKKVL